MKKKKKKIERPIKIFIVFLLTERKYMIGS